MTNTELDFRALARRSIAIMATGGLADFEEVVHPDAHNREGVDEPPASRGRGPAAFYATALWLRAAYSDLKWEEHDAVQDGDLVVMHVTMSGRHTGTFVAYGPDARPVQAFPATGRTFATNHGTATQLGWTPPSPLYLARMIVATRRASAPPGR